MSNVIKSRYYIALDERKMIDARFRHAPFPGEAPERESDPREHPDVVAAQRLSRQILQDAEAHAEACVRQAREEADRLQEQARTEIERWWAERRTGDEEQIAEARLQGREHGYQEGLREAENAVRQQYADKIAEAESVLSQAYALKEQIVQEAEPFLVDVSCAIAEKIIGRQLTISPAWVIDMIKQLLTRRREQSIITLCVAPQHFEAIRNAREELLAVLDSQAELQILPDAKVGDHGCVVRSAFGSIDGRISTQLDEIKAALTQLARQNEGVSHEG